jgi:hypothetical protein
LTPAKDTREALGILCFERLGFIVDRPCALDRLVLAQTSQRLTGDHQTKQTSE